MGEAKVTLIVPTYKRPDLLGKCLEAIVAQTFPDFVALVCDNSPEREAEAVVQEFDDPRIRYTPRSTNLGILGNVLTGFSQATTPWVMEVDDDDLLHPDCLALLVPPLLADPFLSVSFGRLDVVDGTGRRLPERESAAFIRSHVDVKAGVHQRFVDLAIPGLVYMVASVFRTDALPWGEIPSDVGASYDRYVFLVMAARGGRAFHVPEKVVSYRVHPGSDGVTNESRQWEGALAALCRSEREVRGAERSLLAQEILRSRLLLLRACARERRWRAVVRYLPALLGPGTIPDCIRLARSLVERHGSVSAAVQRLVNRARVREAAPE